jgi:hypothetical protein
MRNDNSIGSHARNLCSKPSSHHLTTTMVVEKETRTIRTLFYDTDMKEGSTH